MVDTIQNVWTLSASSVNYLSLKLIGSANYAGRRTTSNFSRIRRTRTIA